MNEHDERRNKEQVDREGEGRVAFSEQDKLGECEGGRERECVEETIRRTIQRGRMRCKRETRKRW